MIRPMDMVSTFTQMVPHTKENGKTTSNMDSDMKNGLMEASIKDNM